MKFVGESDQVKHVAPCSMFSKCWSPRPVFLRGFFSFINFTHRCCGQSLPEAQVSWWGLTRSWYHSTKTLELSLEG